MQDINANASPHTFTIPSAAPLQATNSINNNINNNNNLNSTGNSLANIYNVNKTNTNSSFKRYDTIEWNDSVRIFKILFKKLFILIYYILLFKLSDISLNSFLNEMQSPDKRNIINLINENSRDSIFLNVNKKNLTIFFQQFLTIFCFFKSRWIQLWILYLTQTAMMTIKMEYYANLMVI